MHNNKKKLVRSLAAMLLALAMALPLTACQVEIPGMGTININDGASEHKSCPASSSSSRLSSLTLLLRA